ncbi:MAG: hypothetical protein A3H93_16180 [Rhodocyclales bacterium RIFCSPLOWO2_02_FULL_63_24]|nr:MAG: hypothetical protein A3H93_16180 [Rhodocyclales bacterium RIFCSPLOWO2_02_FULL_63_24]
MKRARIKRIMLWSGLALAVTASIAVTESPADNSAGVVVAASAPSPAVQTDAAPDAAAPKLPGLALHRLTRSPWAESDADPFRAKTWYVAPPAPPPPPPPKPTAPPMPFKYMGALEDTSQGGKTLVYLAKGNDSFQVAVGDKFADAYQLEKIERGQLVIRYLPLSILQTLSTGWTE